MLGSARRLCFLKHVIHSVQSPYDIADDFHYSERYKRGTNYSAFPGSTGERAEPSYILLRLTIVAVRQS